MASEAIALVEEPALIDSDGPLSLPDEPNDEVSSLMSVPSRDSTDHRARALGNAAIIDETPNRACKQRASLACLQSRLL